MRAFFVLSFAVAAFGQLHPLSFDFEVSRSGDAPAMRMNMPTGESHDIFLKKHNVFKDIPSDKLGCAYLGSLKSDPESAVAVTGCFGAEPVQVTIVSRSLSAQYEVSLDGSLEVIPDPFAHEAVRDIAVNHRNKKPAAHDPAFHQDGDELVSNDIEAAANTISCSSNPSASGCTLPAQVLMKVKIHYDQSLSNKVGAGNVQSWINQVMTHTQAFMYDSTLPTKIQIQTVGSPIFHAGVKWRADDDIANVRQYAQGDYTADLHTFFVNDEVQYYGTVGIAYVGVLCTTNAWGYQVSINEWRSTTAATAKVTAHEFGHNLGASHDFDSKHSGRGCTGVMDYGNTPDTWSACSQDDIRDHYSEVYQQTNGNHCMEAVNGGTSPAPSPPAPSPPAPSPPTNNGCEVPSWKGDGYCDDENNNAGCEWDGGDCCGNTGNFWSYYCTQCECKDPAKMGCGSPSWKGDQYCDDENNNAGCDYDGGDCCNNSYYWWSYYCNLCNCYE